MKANQRMMYIAILSLFLMFILASCSPEKQEENIQVEHELTGKKPVVTMTIKNEEPVKIELYPDIAPNTVNNFIALIEEGFYEGLTFHRVISDFMIQGGDPDGNGSGGPGYAIKGEFSSNGHENSLSHEPGVISMARTQDLNSAGSQFFIVTGDATYLDGDYAAFGNVIEGMDVIEKINSVETDDTDRPKEEQIIEKMTVDLKGYEAKDPMKE